MPTRSARYFPGTDQAKINEARQGPQGHRACSQTCSASGEGGRLVVHVAENNVHQPRRLRGQQQGQERAARGRGHSRRSRGAFDPALVQADVQRIRDIYRRSGRGNAKVTSRTVDLPNGKLDVVFTIDEGGKTGVKAIKFVGNQAYSARKLRGLMQTTEMNLLSFFKTSDVYDPDKIAAGRGTDPPLSTCATATRISASSAPT